MLTAVQRENSVDGPRYFTSYAPSQGNFAQCTTSQSRARTDTIVTESPAKTDKIAKKAKDELKEACGVVSTFDSSLFPKSPTVSSYEHFLLELREKIFKSKFSRKVTDLISCIALGPKMVFAL